MTTEGPTGDTGRFILVKVFFSSAVEDLGPIKGKGGSGRGFAGKQRGWLLICFLEEALGPEESTGFPLS